MGHSLIVGFRSTIVVIFAGDTHLSSNFAGREVRGMNVHVGNSGVDGFEHFGKFAGSNTLSVGTDNVGGGNSAGDGSTTSGASARRVWGIGVIAEEDHDAAGHVLLAEMDVSEQGIGN